GAKPGPVSYGQGGENPTTTDANVLTGRLSTRNFDYSADQEKIKKVVNEKIANNFDISEEDASLGIIKIANSNMLNDLKLIYILKRHKPKDFLLIDLCGGW